MCFNIWKEAFARRRDDQQLLAQGQKIYRHRAMLDTLQRMKTNVEENLWANWRTQRGEDLAEKNELRLASTCLLIASARSARLAQVTAVAGVAWGVCADAKISKSVAGLDSAAFSSAKERSRRFKRPTDARAEKRHEVVASNVPDHAEPEEFGGSLSEKKGKRQKMCVLVLARLFAPEVTTPRRPPSVCLLFFCE